MFKKLSFKKTFGLNPKVRDEREVEQIQAIIDLVLSDLAEKFLLQCSCEEQELGTPDSAKIARASIRGLRAQRARVAKTKKSFWKAHVLAETFGFNVKPRAREYLARENSLWAVKAEDYKEG